MNEWKKGENSRLLVLQHSEHISAKNMQIGGIGWSLIAIYEQEHDG